jgi:hypothetical protein
MTPTGFDSLAGHPDLFPHRGILAIKSKKTECGAAQVRGIASATVGNALMGVEALLGLACTTF